jgi:hypothetical protein
MIGGDIWKCRGKTIKTILAYDCFGYDRGFEIEFTDGTRLGITPRSFIGQDEGRVDIKIETQ